MEGHVGFFSAIFVCSFRSVPRRIRPVCKDRGFRRQMPSPRRTANTVLATSGIQDMGPGTQAASSCGVWKHLLWV